MKFYEQQTTWTNVTLKNPNCSFTTITSDVIYLSTNFIDHIEVPSPLEQLVTPENDFKTDILVNSIADNGYIFDISVDDIHITYDNNKFIATDGQHRLIMIEALDIPYFRCKLSIIFEDGNTLAAFRAKKMVEKMRQERLAALIPFTNRFSKDYIEYSLLALKKVYANRKQKAANIIYFPFPPSYE